MLASASILALTMASGSAFARPITGGRYENGGSATNYAAQVAQEAAVQQQLAAARSQDSMSRALTAMRNLTQFQQAAQAIAAGQAGSIPDGLTPGGLVPAVSAPTPYTTTPSKVDPSGVATYDGADYPTQTQTSSGITDVTIRQVAPQAILSWTSFNVGRNTALTFDQQGNSSWSVLNRVVAGTAPSTILGSIHADGRVLIINHNGVIFGGGSQINVGSLIATSLDIGSTLATTIANSNDTFMSPPTAEAALAYVGADQNGVGIGDILVQPGATVETTSTGQIILMGHHVTNEGILSSPDGQVILAAGEAINFVQNTGDANSADPNLRGLLVTIPTPSGLSSFAPSTFYVDNAATGIVEAERGNITLVTDTNISPSASIVSPSEGGAILVQGSLWSTTSVSRNGSIFLSGGDIDISGTGQLAIAADTSGETIPQNPASLGAFKTSEILIGASALDVSNVVLESGAFVYAPSANVKIGRNASVVTTDPINGGQATPSSGTTSQGYVASTFIDTGAVIDVAGIANVLVPASRNEVTIKPITGNDLQNSPLLRTTFNGLTIYLDPRKSGVRADGVAWIGSPLIDAAAYYQLVGVGAAELMTKGGNVSIGGGSSNLVANTPLGGVFVKPGAIIDVSGGWVSYESGIVRESLLIDSNGRIVTISDADPNDNYVGVYQGFTVYHPHWGITEIYADPFKSDSHFEPSYIEGRDAGSLAVNASTAALDETLHASSYVGLRQLIDSKPGTATSSNTNDHRPLQGAPSQLPAGGLLSVTAGVDINVSDHSPLPADPTQPVTVSIPASGVYTAPSPQSASQSVTTSNGLQVSDRLAADSGLAQLSLASSGAITIASGSNIVLQPGGAFTANSGRRLTIDGSISAPGGTIDLRTGDGGIGSVLVPSVPALGSYDITVNGTLSVAGQWVNDIQYPVTPSQNHAWLNGGTISMFAASNLLVAADGEITTGGRSSPPLPGPVTDVSGSIIIDPRSRLRLESGGRIDAAGNMVLTATGGNLSLRSATAYFETQPANNLADSGLRAANTVSTGGNTVTLDPVVNPSQINARISFDQASIEAHGFGGGGTFTLETPQITIGTGSSSLGTVLPLDFFSRSGFANFAITSYKTAFSPSRFNNGYGGFNALLATQTITIGAGQVLSLNQSVLPSFLDVDQSAALGRLASGGDITSILAPITPSIAWDQKAVNLGFGGLVELDVAQGGAITGAAGSTLAAPKILNEGTIRIAGGAIFQEEVLPAFYGSGNGGVAAGGGTSPYLVPAIGIRTLGDAFSINSDGTIDVDAASKVNPFNSQTGTYDTTQFLSNGDLAGNFATNSATPLYFLGRLDSDQGIVLAPGSVTNLSGTVLANPRAMFGSAFLHVGRTVGGGSIATAPTTSDLATSYLGVNTNHGWIAPERLVAEPGAKIDLAGTSADFDVVGLGGRTILSRQVSHVPSWSDGGTLLASNGTTLTGAIIDAQGGSPSANGGSLDVLSPILVAHDPGTAAADVISADMIAKAGFENVMAIGSISSKGDVSLALRGTFVLQGVSYDAADNRHYVYGANGVNATAALVVPQVRSGGGRLEIDAGYIALQSTIDTLDPVSLVNVGVPGPGSVIFNAGAIDVTGAVLFDQSVADATLTTTGDLRLIGIQPWQLTYGVNAVNVAPALTGGLATNGNLALIANRIYPTTGSTFAVTSAATNGTITLGRAGGASNGAPYSAGANLSLDAAAIVDGGNIRVPFGTLTLGSSASVNGGSILGSTFAPPTQSVTLLPGSVTGVSADGLDIPFGTTTDLKEWFFTPTNASALTAPPPKVLGINATNITVEAGATLDLTGGGDVYAYEFVSGPGGSRDVLSRFNPDPFGGNKGYQYPDQRQIYAIVPGLSDATVAAYDPIYAADDTAIVRGSMVGTRVYLDAAPGLTAGWYTLLPAQYALLPGGERVVEQTGATSVLPGTAGENIDGSFNVSGHYGNAIAGTAQSQERLFSVENQNTFLKYSNIVTTSGNAIAVTTAAKSGLDLAPIGPDAGRLILNPSLNLIVDAQIDTAPAAGGRGAMVDIGGRAFDIVSNLSQAPNDGAIHLTATSLDNLNAASLLIGGVRTDNADGTTNLTVTAQSINVANDLAHPIVASEIILAVDDLFDNAVASHLTLQDGATLIAEGALLDTRNGHYIINGLSTSDANTGVVVHPTDSGHGALIRVANGPQRAIVRTIDPMSTVPEAVLTGGAATLSGTDLTLDSSDQNHLSSGLVFLNDQRITIGAKRIAFGANPALYSGLVITDALKNQLAANGADLTLHSQSSIDFAGGTYDLNNVTFDTPALSSLDGTNVTINGNTIGLSNSGAAADCQTCNGTGARLAINANQILFKGGTMSLKGAILDTNVAVTLASDAPALLPAGTVIHDPNGFDIVLSAPTTVIIPKGIALTAVAGLGLSLVPGVDGASTLVQGDQITATGTVAASLPVGNYTFPSNFLVVSGSGAGVFPPGTYGLSANVATLSPGSVLSLSSAATVSRRSLFGGGVDLAAQSGIFAAGQADVFDVGAAPLVLATPLLGDRSVTGLSNEPAYDATFQTGGALSVVRGAMPIVDGAGIVGTPGSAITLAGQTIDIDASTVRATAGTVTLQAADGISVENGATLAAPGYTKTFGDRADPQVRSAAGGAVTLLATDGDITLGQALLSVAGGDGDAGTLTLSAGNGAIDLSQVRLDGSGATGGTFVYSAKGGVDANALNQLANHSGFTGGFDVAVAQGDLTLGAGQILRSAHVSLTANEGTVDIAGTIDTSGINGGDISLYGRDRVVLEETAALLARASGYGLLDTRQAKGGNVLLGTDLTSATANADGSITGSSGTISVDTGSLIDVSATRPGDRLVPINVNGVSGYEVVRGDVGGTLSFRAPVVLDANGREMLTVDVASSDSVVGASRVTLEGFRRWDLQAVANSGRYVGVTCSVSPCVGANATVTLDLRAGLDTANADGTLTTVGGVNFLGDHGTQSAPTVVDFIQNFDLSAGSTYGQLGGLADRADFHAQPGIDLFASGNIVLTSNWNLGAGTVNLTAAQNAGDVTVNPLLQIAGNPTSGYVVNPGAEADIFQNYTSLLYRTGGSVSGEAPIVTLRGGGNLNLQGSISDGTFLFRDQTDQTYLSQTQLQDQGYLATSAGFYIASPGQALTNFATWDGQDVFSGGTDNYLALALFGSAAVDIVTNTNFNTISQNQAPYNVAGNSPAALETVAGSAGDAIGSAIVFPLLANNKAPASSSYRLVAGASVADAATISVNPTEVNPSSNASLTVQGLSSYTYYAGEHPSLLDPTLFVDTSYDISQGIGGNQLQQFDSQESLPAFLTSATHSPEYSNNALAIIYINDGFSGDPANQALVGAAFSQFVHDRGLHQETDYRFSLLQDGSGNESTLATTQYIALAGRNFKDFVQHYLIPISTQIAGNLLNDSHTTGFVQGTTVPVQPAIRTGTGSIALAAAANVDLRGSIDPVYFDASAGQTAQPVNSTAQLGGIAVYTLGHRADPTVGSETLIDPLSNQQITVDLSSGFEAVDGSTRFADPTAGGPTGTVGSLGVDPVILTGGGDIRIAAGTDVQGRYGAYFNNNANIVNAHPWDVTASLAVIPQPDGSLLTALRSGIDPQLFHEGVGALGGGDIKVDAGGNVSDLTFAIDGAAVYGQAAVGTGGTTDAALRFGGGALAVTAGRDIVGGRLDLASGNAVLASGGVIRSASTLTQGSNGNVASDLPLDIAANDATVALSARGGATLAQFLALGGGVASSQAIFPTNAPSDLFTINTYSPASGLSIVANGDVTITNHQYFDTIGGTIRATPIYPGSLTIDAIDGSISLPPLLMNPSADGQLRLDAGWDIDPTAIAMLDNQNVVTLAFPAVLPNSTSTYLANLHDPALTHSNDPEPAYIYAGHDLDQLTLALPKQARVWAGRDIVDMMFFGQNLATSDITRVVAGRDITVTTRVITPESAPGVPISNAAPEPALQGNSFVIGGPGTFMLEAGRDIGPFLNSAVSQQTVGSPQIDTFFGGVIAVGNAWNPYLPQASADIDILFGVAKGADFNALRDTYVVPGSIASTTGDYGTKLVAWMQDNEAQTLQDAFGTSSVTQDQAYAAFVRLPELQQRRFLIGHVYFNELAATVATTPAVYRRGYEAVDTLFPASFGYTANSLNGGSNGATGTVKTGDLDLRLAAVETQQGGAINILGPGGNIIAGSVVATAVQAARRSYQGYNLYSASPLDYNSAYLPFYNSNTDTPIGNGSILSIPPGGEGILTLRGGDINTFTDESVLINQSRLFTEGGGNIVLWSSNGDLNAGQGPKTSANFPPVVAKIDDYGHTTIDKPGSVTGAGIAALSATPDAPQSNVDLIAPRGTVDAGAAGVRVSGNLSVAALTVVNGDNFQVSGASVGVPTVSTPSASGLTSVGNAADAAAKTVPTPTGANAQGSASIIIVEFLGYGGGSDADVAPATPDSSHADDSKKHRKPQ